MANQVQICNMALGAFGQRAIASIDEQSEQARKCKLFYDQARLATLRGSPWVFATKIETLALIDDQTIPGWNYLYQYPPTAVSILKVYTDISDGNSAYNYRNNSDYFSGYDDYDFKHELSDDFRIVQDPTPNTSNRAIASNSPDAYVEYTKNESNNDLFDPNFVEAFIYKLAAMIAKPLTGDDNTVKEMIGIYQATIDKATRINSQQKFGQPFRTSSTVNSR